MTGAMIARRPPVVGEVGCDNCGAVPGDACRERDGTTRYLDHVGRLRAAALVQSHAAAAVLTSEAHIAAAGDAI